MEFDLQKAQSEDALEFSDWSLAIHGHELDERGNAAIKCIKRHSSHIISLYYDPEKFVINIDGEEIEADNLVDFLRTKQLTRVVLEASTLGFSEILLCCRALRILKIKSFDFLYVEPSGYRNPKRKNPINRRDFELSDVVHGYRAIPGFALLLEDRLPQKGVFFLGYEDARLRRAFEDLQMIQASRAAFAIGVPAFQAGWETDAIANNISVIREQKILGGVHFCGAENPLAAFEVLENIKMSLQPGERLFIAPIGTKPHGIAVALFASANDKVGVIYDHPNRTSGRSKSIANWHIYSVRNY